MTYSKFVITSGTSPGTGYAAYSSSSVPASNLRMAFGKILPSASANGRKPQLIIYLHGIDHREPTPSSDSDHASVDEIITKGVPLVAHTADIPEVKVNGSNDAADLIKTAVLFPQCSSSYGVWPYAYLCEAIKYAYNNMANEVDLNRIHVVGYSLGGGGGMSLGKAPFINERIATLHVIASGYNILPYTSGPSYDYLVASGLPIFVYHSTDDPTTPSGASVSRTYVNGLNTRNPLHPVQYLEFAPISSGNDHDTILPIVVNKDLGSPRTLSNGNIWTPTKTLYEICAYHTIHRRKRL